MIKNSNKYFSPLFKFQRINGIWLVQKKTFLLVTRGACQSSYRKWKPACHLGDEKRRSIIETRQILSLLQPINHCTSGVDVIWSRHPTKLGLIETEVKRDGDNIFRQVSSAFLSSCVDAVDVWSCAASTQHWCCCVVEQLTLEAVFLFHQL